MFDPKCAIYHGRAQRSFSRPGSSVLGAEANVARSRERGPVLRETERVLARIERDLPSLLCLVVSLVLTVQYSTAFGAVRGEHNSRRQRQCSVLWASRLSNVQYTASVPASSPAWPAGNQAQSEVIERGPPPFLRRSVEQMPRYGNATRLRLARSLPSRPPSLAHCSRSLLCERIETWNGCPSGAFGVLGRRLEQIRLRNERAARRVDSR